MPQTDLTGLPPDRVAVLLIDFQNQFCHPRACGDGPVTNTRNAAAAGRANAIAAEAAAFGAKVVYTRQVLDLARLTERQYRWDREPQPQHGLRGACKRAATARRLGGPLPAAISGRYGRRRTRFRFLDEQRSRIFRICYRIAHEHRGRPVRALSGAVRNVPDA